MLFISPLYMLVMFFQYSQEILGRDPAEYIAIHTGLWAMHGEI